MDSKNSSISSLKKIIAVVGMPGAGKSEVASYLKHKGIPFVRFGDATDEGLKEKGLPINAENEQKFRENLRAEIGMAAYAIKAEPKINELLKSQQIVALDGLRSWEEYTYLKEKFSNLILINIYTEPEIRYKRLSERQVRSFTPEESHARDVAELVNLHMGGPIALADYLVENNSDVYSLHKKLDTLLQRIGV